MSISNTKTMNCPIIPRRVMPGDTIGIVAPSSPFNIRYFRAGVATIKSLGFKVKIPRGLHRRNGYLAGSDRHRSAIVNQLFKDKSVNAIICARGGFGALKILSHLDYKTISKNPKVFVGFSDVSALLSVFYSKCGLVTFHGPMAVSMANSTRKTQATFLEAISSEKRIRISPLRHVTIHPGYKNGPVVGGNLTTLCHLVGTPFQPEYKNQILLLEEAGEAVYRIDRMLTHMKMAGCFKGIAGLVLGCFTGCGCEDDIFTITRHIFQEFDIPILGGFDIGHGKHNITIPIGLNAALDTDCGCLTFSSIATQASGPINSLRKNR